MANGELCKELEKVMNNYFSEAEAQHIYRNRYYFLIHPNDAQFILDDTGKDISKWCGWYYCIEDVDMNGITFNGSLMTAAEFEGNVTLIPNGLG